ncbi:MAG: DNA-binding response regulator [Actinobacteria bacterium]|nr:DNA-binding response regulator [Actinomycetota bacterium]NBY14864.1 DNA-binding response regulator [Actinomycetota bacterium]
MNILLIEDDPSVASSVKDSLEHENFVVQHVATGKAGIAEAKSGVADMILLDLGLPDIDGQQVCRTIRLESSTPIIILSARSEEVDRVLALEFGADDYLVKPFGTRELVARIRAVSRRTSLPEVEAAATEKVIGALKIDTRSQRVYVDNVEVTLTSKEFDLLVFLCSDPGAVRRRNDIMRDVWDTDWYQTTKTVDAHIASLRKKLGHQDWIEAVRGVGFRISIPSS